MSGIACGLRQRKMCVCVHACVCVCVFLSDEKGLAELTFMHPLTLSDLSLVSVF